MLQLAAMNSSSKQIWWKPRTRVEIWRIDPKWKSICKWRLNHLAVVAKATRVRVDTCFTRRKSMLEDYTTRVLTCGLKSWVYSCLLDLKRVQFSDSFGENRRNSFKTSVTWLVDARSWFGVDWCSLIVVKSSSSKTADKARGGETSHKFAEVQPTVGRWRKSRSSCKYNPIISIQAIRTSLDTVST